MTEELKTLQQLKAELDAAFDKGDMRAVAAISKQIVTQQAGAEKAAHDAKLAALASITLKLKSAIDAVVAEAYDKGELDAAEGVWYSQDFEESITSCRLIKRQSAGGTGGTHAGKGKKFASTAELLKEHGDEVAEAETGKTWNELYADAKGDGNKVFSIRMRLAKTLNLV